jgi:hypothetical protein
VVLAAAETPPQQARPKVITVVQVVMEPLLVEGVVEVAAQTLLVKALMTHLVVVMAALVRHRLLRVLL